MSVIRYSPPDELGDWLSTVTDWQVFVCVTFRFQVAEREAHRRFKRFCQMVARNVAHEHLYATWGWAPQWREIIHFHVLFGSASERKVNLSPVEIESQWLWGNVKAEVVRNVQAAEHYILGHEYWMIPTVVCPRHAVCRRRHGCSVSPAPWPNPGEGLKRYRIQWRGRSGGVDISRR